MNSDKLPQLPIPELESTLDRYLTTIQPWVSDDYLEKHRRVVDMFRNGLGQELHRRLLERAKLAESLARNEHTSSSTTFRPHYEPQPLNHQSPSQSPQQMLINSSSEQLDKQSGHRQSDSSASLIEQVPVTKSSWLIDWWNQYSYLRYREPVVINVSFFFTFPDDQRRMDRQFRAASLIYYAMDFRQQIIDGTLTVETMRNAPLCMRQYQFLFNATRLPRLPSDHVAIYDPRLNGHVAVVCRDNYYIVECFDSQRRLSVQELHGQLQWIAQHSQHQQQVPENQRISYLTAAHRDRWTAAYDSLRSESPLNSRSLDRLQSAAFLICLDDGQPQNIEQLSRACWHGDGSSRWFDKSFQLICFANGKAGCLGEHSMFDATVPARMCDYILDRCFQECPPSVQSSLDDKRVGVPVEWLPFDLNAEISQSIQEAKSNLDKAIGAHDLRVLQYAGYGKELIKQFQVSPDSFVQMAIQLAYFKMMGTWVATYETAGMRRYNWGRTETCRSVSIDSVAFIKAMEDQSIAVEQKAQLARKAIQTHSQYMADCLAGKGIDRHFLGLRLCLHPNEQMPELFLDPAYNLSCHWTLSTSQIPTNHFEGYGWGEVVPDGFGVAYMVKDNSLHFNVTGLIGDAVPDLEQPEIWSDEFRLNYKHNRVEWFRDCLAQSLDAMRFVFSPATSPPPMSPGCASMPLSPLATTITLPPAMVPAFSHLSESMLDKLGQLRAASAEQSQSLTTTTGSTAEESAVSAPQPQSLRHRPSSIQSAGADSSRRLGFTLAYPTRQESGNLYASGGAEGVVGEDVGYIELDWGETRAGEAYYNRGKKILRMLTRLGG